LQGLFCGVLQVIVQKLSERESFKAGILQFADQIMEVLLQVIRIPCNALQLCAESAACVCKCF